jgi:hypothetical protein
MWEITRSKLETERKKKGITYASIASHLGYSDTSIHRWLAEPKGENGKPCPKQPIKKNAPPYDVIVQLADFIGCDINEITSAVGENELKKSQDINYMGTEALLCEMEKWKEQYNHHCEEALAHERELRTQSEEHYKALLAEKDRRYETVVAYLKHQVERSRITIIILLILFVVALVTLAVVLAANPT